MEDSAGCKVVGKHENPTVDWEVDDYCFELAKNDSDCGKSFFSPNGPQTSENSGKCVCEKKGLDCTRTRNLTNAMMVTEFRLD